MMVAPFLIAMCFAAPPTTEALVEEFSSRSYPVEPALRSRTNPWGERLPQLDRLPENFSERVAAAAEAYAQQGIRFDGYLGSDDDGRHYLTAADGEDLAYYGDREIQGYRERRNGEVDDLTERTWICLDLPIHSLSLAGFPIREAILDDWAAHRDVYTFGGTFPENEPKTHWFFRRIRNLRLYFEHAQKYSEQRITIEEVRDPAFRPEDPFQRGDIVFFGHYGDADGENGWWDARHSGVVASVDKRGMPELVYNMRVSKDLLDYYDGTINQTRTVDGEEVFFERFSDRYSLIGFGRIVRAYEPAEIEPVD